MDILAVQLVRSLLFALEVEKIMMMLTKNVNSTTLELTSGLTLLTSMKEDTITLLVLSKTDLSMSFVESRMLPRNTSTPLRDLTHKTFQEDGS